MDEALRHTEAMIADGADIIDCFASRFFYSTHGHTPVSADEEAQRILPVIEAVKKHFDIPVSVDTFKSSVAESSIQAGADLVNDIWITRLFSLTSWTRTKEHPFMTPITLVAKVPSTR